MSGIPVDVAAFGSKAGIGKTGVHFRFYTFEEYKKLSKDQKNELREWRKANPDEIKKNPTKKAKADKMPTHFKTDKQIVAAIAKGIEEGQKKVEKDKADEEATQAYVLSMIEKASTVGAATAKTAKQQPKPPASILKSILKRSSFKSPEGL